MGHSSAQLVTAGAMHRLYDAECAGNARGMAATLHQHAYRRGCASAGGLSRRQRASRAHAAQPERELLTSPPSCTPPYHSLRVRGPAA
jgi:hypothetical protein